MGLLWDTPEEKARKERTTANRGMLGARPVAPEVVTPFGDSRMSVNAPSTEGSGFLATNQDAESQSRYQSELLGAGYSSADAASLIKPFKEQSNQQINNIKLMADFSKAQTEQSLKQGNVLRKQRDEKLTPFNEAKTQYDTTMNALQQDSGAGTLAAIFSFMKTLDPRSVVREGEFQMGTQTGGVVDSLVGMVNRAKGEGMGPEARRGISEAIQAIMEGRVAQAEEIARRFDQIATEQNVPTSQIKTGAYNPELQGVPEYFNVDKDTNLPSGTKNIGNGVLKLPDGTLIRKK